MFSGYELDRRRCASKEDCRYASRLDIADLGGGGKKIGGLGRGDGKKKRDVASTNLGGSVDDQIWQVQKNQTIQFPIPYCSVLAVSEQS
jgi:hypothetical protein